ncbi:hypothetical protein [Mucilaginibacter sp.]|uniref:hypothetical protein n=1 Tax=Mucilaginibacter sp. TaxID=1882438 RepID=UPI003D0CC567
MNNTHPLIPATAVKGIASGMVMMAAFTTIWAILAYNGLSNNPARFALVIFPILSLVFLINALKLFRMAKYYPPLTSEADIAEEKRVGKWFGIIFGAEGLGIFIAINIVINLGHPELTMPVIALVVGLHFYPLAKVFKRTIDYYLATWSTLIAVLAIVFSLNKTLTQNGVFTLLGVGIALATASYGTYMMLSGWKIPKTAEQL